jgi:thiol-disulfide isomerase/thioredoxin
VRSAHARWIVPALLFLATAARAGEAPTLKVGDPAPRLFVSKWIKGEPVPALAKGTVYVIECWATWCGPCRASIPHVSGLQAKYKEKGVVVIGLNVWEKDTAGVEPFVKKMGDTMAYRVALDEVEKPGEAGKSARAWLVAAGQEGIPCAFVVDKETKIAWIGHPMDGLDEVLEGVVAGTFDPKKLAEQREQKAALQEKIQQAFVAKDWGKLFPLLDEAAAGDPASAGRIGRLKVNLLLTGKQDYKAGYALAVALASKELKDDAEALNEIAWTILDDKRVATRDLDLAMSLATRADAVTNHENPAILDTLARAQFEKGDVDKAVETQTRAVEKAGDDEMRKQLTESLSRYKEKKAGAK